MKKSLKIGFILVVVWVAVVSGAFAQSEQGQKLCDAAYDGDIAEVEKLLKSGTKVDARSDKGSTALMAAAQAGRLDIAKLLIKKGANVNARRENDKNEFTPLFFAVGNGKTDVVNLLIANDADLEVAEKSEGMTALHLAVIQGQKEAAEILINAGANIEAKSKKGLTPLMFAAYTGNKELVSLLASNGANLHSRDFSGFTAARYAAEMGHADVVALLGLFGAQY